MSSSHSKEENKGQLSENLCNQNGVEVAEDGCKTHSHDASPVIFSDTYHYPYPQTLDEEYLASRLEQLILDLVEWVKSRGGLVGHVKILVEGKKMCFLSSTGGCVYTRSQEYTPKDYSMLVIYVTAIGINVPQEYEQYCRDMVESSLLMITGADCN